ncbi:MAG TPA: BrnT family toxin [bacterium]|nr:BrnT family toxin [bacterium]HQN73350.1 BrnT family toxin [bacterium]HQO90877.1 BrnT family toxin [bacterium]
MEFIWNEEKNNLLKRERGISFEMVVEAIFNDKIIDVVSHPNIEKYGHQKIYVIDFNGYCYLVPFVETEDGDIFLKTVFPSRKAVREYKGGK